MLSGKKTYIVAICSIIGSAGSFYAGAITFGEFMDVVLPAVLGMTIRDGIAKSKG